MSAVCWVHWMVHRVQCSVRWVHHVVQWVHWAVHRVQCVAVWVHCLLHWVLYVMHWVHWVLLWVHCSTLGAMHCVLSNCPVLGGIQEGRVTSHHEPCHAQDPSRSCHGGTELWEDCWALKLLSRESLHWAHWSWWGLAKTPSCSEVPTSIPRDVSR